MPFLLYRGVRVRVVYFWFVSCNFLVGVLLWKILSGYLKSFCMKAGTWSSSSNLETYPCVCVWLSTSLSTLYSYILHCYSCSYLFILDIVYIFILVFNQESYWSTSTLSLEESRGEVLEPFTGIRLHSWLNVVCLHLVFNSALFVIRLALHLFTPL